jgi:hypothetical protein
MNPFMSNEMAQQRIAELQHKAAQANRAGRDGSADLTLRFFEERDVDRVVRLAALDGKPVPSRGVLVAEQGGRVVAALPLDGGDVLADPFRRTADAVEMLHVRAAQLLGGRRRRLRARMRR